MARHFRGTGHIAALHRVHGRRLTRTAGGSTTSSRPPRSSSDRRRAVRSSRSSPTTAARSRERWRYRDGGGEIGVIASVTPAVLRRLHARAALGRGQALHLPVRRPRPRPARAAAVRSDRRRDLRDAIASRSGRVAPTATRSSAPPRRPSLPKIEDVLHRRLGRSAGVAARARTEAMSPCATASPSFRTGLLRRQVEPRRRGPRGALHCSALVDAQRRCACENEELALVVCR